MKNNVFTVLLLVLLLIGCGSQNRDKAHLIDHVQIYASHDEYCAWPAMIRAMNGDLLVNFCINEEHLGPDGKIVMMRSKDNGRTWTGPETMYETPIDDRHAGLTVLKDGTIVTHTTSTFWTREKYANLAPNSYNEEMIARWSDHVDQPEYKSAQPAHGQVEFISTDHGHTWSDTTKGKDSIHGGLQLDDGSLLVASYRGDKGSVGVYTKTTLEDDWRLIATIDSPTPDSLRLGEPHILQLPSGRIVMMIRATAIPYNDMDPRCFLHGAYSDDNGATWTGPYATPLWGFPPHLLQLSDGRILCTYGYRRPPFGQRACISEDGVTWKIENEIILRDNACNQDLGYPVSIELEPGIVLSVYYQPDPDDCPQMMTPPDPERSRPDILGTIWQIPEAKN
ncbi:MAG: sialidase family protein [candidate division KSB1 bacterium]|jgi:hypothetical protein|nr:sialidase family protein [candidate division KSB1 bacterium]